MSEFDWKSVIASVAPALATALGGPLAGAATVAIGKALGVTTSEVPEAIKAVTTDDLLKIKAAEDLFTKDMAKLGIDILNIEAKDRDSARQREGTVKDNTPRVLAYMVTGGFCVTCALILAGAVQVDSVLTGTVLGYATANSQQVLSYYFGSTSGSEMKTRIMSALGSKKP